jgi:hypothetical protein
VWRDPETHQIVYVGKTTTTVEKRFQQQVRTTRRSSTASLPTALRWLANQLARDRRPIVKAIAILTAGEAGPTERAYGQRLAARGCQLLNDPTAYGAGSEHHLATARRRDLEPWLGLFPTNRSPSGMV